MSASDRTCEELARANHGIITFEEARDAGLSESEIDYRGMHRGWSEVHPNVFRMPGVPDSLDSRRAAAVKAGGDGAALSHRTAGSMLELEGIEAGDEIEIVAHSGITLQGVKVHRIGKNDVPRTVLVKGLPVTRVERVLIDLAGCLPIPVVGIAIDYALRKRLTTLSRLWAELEAVGGRGRRGTKAFRVLLSARDELTAEMRSTFEAKMRRILKRIKGYRAIPNYKVITPNGARFFDFCYPDLKLAIECQSIDWHTGERMKRDLKRHRELEAIGYKILYFTWDEVCFEADMVEREVRKAIETRQLFLPA